MASRNRPESLSRCLSSLVAALPPEAEIICVDQSDYPLAREKIPAAARLSYLPSPRRGACAARNDGAAAAGGELLLFTDDDCIVAPGWVEAWLGVFDGLPTADIGFGPVRALEPDWGGGFTPGFDPGARDLRHGMGVLRRGPQALGLGANMAIRRAAWRDVGGFDEVLGVGSHYAGAEESDIAYRVLRGGGELIHHAGPPVVHDGFRPQAEAARLSMRYSAGAGAMYMKHVRCGDPRAMEYALINTWRMLRAPALGLVTGKRPLGLRALWAYSVGATSSLRLGIDHSRRRYRSGSLESRTAPGAPAPDPSRESSSSRNARPGLERMGLR